MLRVDEEKPRRDAEVMRSVKGWVVQGGKGGLDLLKSRKRVSSATQLPTLKR